ncbi:MAG: magnesium/cobalt transporter CorA [Spirochaetaceae bacterium]|nr:magnesium/cobalt transporter CorA [Spirochaetaceae bacterium]
MAKRNIFKPLSPYSKNAGLPPGALHETDEESLQVEIDIMQYNRDSFSEERISRSELSGLSPAGENVLWINISGTGDSSILKELETKFTINHLSLEDIQNTEHRPKIDDFGNYIHFILKMLTWDQKIRSISNEQVSIILGKNYVISIQEKPGDVFDNIRDRIRNGRGRVRHEDADYLSYALIDAIVDNYFLICDRLQEEQEILEENANVSNSKETFRNIHHLKKQIILLRKSVWPLREILISIQKDDFELIREKTLQYYRDIFDHLLFIVDLVEQLREMLSGLQESLISTISFEMNNVMKVLTIIATIFIPLTFVAGIYGMNFSYMPELTYKWGYFGVLGFMILVFIIMIFFFKKKKWL